MGEIPTDDARDVELHALCCHVLARVRQLGLDDHFRIDTTFPARPEFKGSRFDENGILKLGITDMGVRGEYVEVDIVRSWDGTLSALFLFLEGVRSRRSEQEAAAALVLSRFYGAVMSRIFADPPVSFWASTELTDFTEELASEVLGLDKAFATGKIRQWVILHLTHPILTGIPAAAEDEHRSSTTLRDRDDRGRS